MAAPESGIRRREGLIDAFLVPRPVTQVLLLALGVSLAELAWLHLTPDLLVYVSGLAGPFCMLCATAIWSMRDKVDEALDPDYLDAEEFRKSRRAHRAIRNRSMFQAALVAMCALAAFSPAISKQLTGSIWHWMMLLAGAGVARSAYGYLLAAAWEVQLLEHRERLIQAKKDAEAKSNLEAAIRSGSASALSFPGWTEVGGELGQGKPH